MKIVKRLLSSFMIIVLLQNIIVFNVWAEEGSESESYEQIYDMGDMAEDMGETAEITDMIDDVNSEAEERVNEEENETVIVEEETDVIDENENTTENMAEGETEEITETESVTETAETETAETEAETYEAVSEETVTEETETQETEVSTEDNVTGSEGSSGGSNGDKINSDKAEITSSETITEAVTDGLFNTISGVNGAGEITHNITLILNGGSLRDEIWTENSMTVPAGGSVILPVSIPVQTGAVFWGWSDTPDSDTIRYKAGDTIRNIKQDTSLYAVWEWEEYSVSFRQNADDENALWEATIEYGYNLWSDRSLTPWLDVAESEWIQKENDENEQPLYTADVNFNKDAEGEPVNIEVTKRQNTYIDSEGAENIYVYYTFVYNNTKWFTAPEGIAPAKEGFTFRDWYMTEPEAGGMEITDNTVYIARYMDTGGYVANVNYRYTNKRVAADSRSFVLEYGKENEYIEFEFTAPEIEGYYPIIKSSSITGVELYDSEGKLISIGSEGLETYTGEKENADEDGNTAKEYVYKVRISIDASFTTPEGEDIEEDEEAGIHCIAFNIEYYPEPTGYRVSYFREVLGESGTQHSNEYELYEYIEVIYDDNKSSWEKARYTPAEGAALKNETQTTDEGGVYYEYSEYKKEVIGTIEDISEGYHKGDVVIPENKEYTVNEDGSITNSDYEGFVMGRTSVGLTETGVELEGDKEDNNINLYYSRKDYHIYYITDSEAEGIQDELYVYGAAVNAPGAVTKTGYALDTSKGTNGWIYYTDVPRSGENADNSNIFLNGTGYRPDTMPARDVFAKAQWKEADSSYTVNVWFEAANYNHYVREYQVTIESTTGTVLNRDAIIDVFKGRGNDGYGEEILGAVEGADGFDSVHFTFNEDYTGNDLTNPAEIIVASDGSTEFDVLYDRNWYVVEMILGRSYTQWGRTYYQVARGTNGSFKNSVWEGQDVIRSLPGIKFDDEVIDVVEADDYTYYRLDDGPYSTTYNYSDGTRRYLGAYGLYTDDYVINSDGTNYTCSVYYIYAKYGADISSLWPAVGNSIEIDYDEDEHGNNYKYVSMGTASGSAYRANNNNPNILNVYSTMSDEILNDAKGEILKKDYGFEPGLNVDGKNESEPNAIMRSNYVNHQMVAYWYNPTENVYYRLIEILDNSSDVEYSLEVLDQYVGDTKNPGEDIGDYLAGRTLEIGDIVKWNNKYYRVDSTTIQRTSNSLTQQTQPALQGFESMGKAYQDTGNSGSLYFFYDRERYDVGFYNVKGSYFPPESVLDVEFEMDDGTVSTLRKQGFDMPNPTSEGTGNERYGSLTVKYGADCTCLDKVSDYLLNYGRAGSGSADRDEYDNKLGLRYANPTRGSKEWTFDNWYQDSSYETVAWDVTYCQSAYCSFVLYSKWDPPQYDVNIHLGIGEYEDTQRREGQIWIGADVPSDEKADVDSSTGEYVYTAAKGEGSIVYAPYPPSASGYRFVGWYYFNTAGDEGEKVYLNDVIGSSDANQYNKGNTYVDYFGMVRLVEEDDKGLYYYNNVRGLRYIFGETSPVYGEVNVYAVFEGYNAEKYNVMHIIEKSQLDSRNIENIGNWQVITINGTKYYLIDEENNTGREIGETYSTYAQFGKYVTGNDGTRFYLFPDIESQDVRMYRNPGNHYTSIEVEGDKYTYDGEGTIFYYDDVSDAESRYTYYVMFEYSIASELPYTVWYVDIDEARALGELTDENGAHPYYSRYETPEDMDNIFLLPSEARGVTLENFTDGNITVTETAKDIPGYTLLGEYQENLSLLANGSDNNIYFYYRRQSSNATYTIKYHIMEDNKYSSDKTIEIKNMPGVSGTEERSAFIAEYYSRYIREVLESGNIIEGREPYISVTDGKNEYTWTYGDDSSEIESICLDMLNGTVNDIKSSTPYILVTAADGDKVIDVYMRYGSVRIIKYNDDGDRLKGAGFTLTRINPDGSRGNVYTGVTDGNGEYVFYNLWIDDSYTYEIVETTAPGDNYQLLKEPINISLPFTSSEPLNNEYDYEEEGTYYWYDINCEITDGVKFDLPITGGRFNVGVMSAGIGMIFIAVMLMLALNKNKARAERNDKNIKTIITKKFKFKERGAIMKNSRFKRFLAALCSMVMLFSVFSVGAGAANDFNIDESRTGSITITKKDTGDTNVVSGIMFRTVKVADMVQYTDDTQTGVTSTSLKFKLTDAGKTIFSGYLPKVDTEYPQDNDGENLYSTSDIQEALTGTNGLINKSDSNGTDISQNYKMLAEDVANANGGSSDLNKSTGSDGTLSFRTLPLGVYLVVEDLGNSTPQIDGSDVTISKASTPFLVTVPQTEAGSNEAGASQWDYDVEVVPKNIIEGSKATKTVDGDNISEGSNGLITTDTVTIGDEFTYTVTSKIVKTTDNTKYEKFVLTDKAGDGISYVNFTPETKEKFITVKLGSETLTYGTDYTLTIHRSTNTFTLEFTDPGLAKLNAVTEETDLVFTYTGYLNENAKVDLSNTKNSANIEYKLKGDETTVDNPDPVPVYTHGIRVNKEFAGDKSADATKVSFKLTDADKNPLYAKKNTDGSYTVDTKIEEVSAENNTYDTFNCLASGQLSINGLANGTYYLTEVSTSEGFSLLKEPITVTVENGIATLTVLNEEKPIFELPLTGGSGTWIYTVGGMALIGVALFMVSKIGKKKTA